MRLTISHRTDYRYEAPIYYAIQTIRLTPQPHEGMRILSWSVLNEAGKPLQWNLDGLANVQHIHTVNRLHDHSAVVAEGLVETFDTQGIIRGAPEPLPPAFYLRPTGMTEPDAAVEELAHSVTASQPLDRLHQLAGVIRDRVDYVTGTTEVTTTGVVALAQGKGVCQDHAHIFISACHVLGIPARYVGGYLWTGEEEVVHEASHAWAEAYVEDLGWVGFDIANRISPTDDHVRVAVGLDYAMAAPIRGIRRGLAEERLDVALQVLQAQQ